MEVTFNWQKADNRREILPWYEGWTVVYVDEENRDFWNGDYLMIVDTTNEYRLYYGYNGSCSDCDKFMAAFEDIKEITKSMAGQWLEDNPGEFAACTVIPYEAMKTLLQKNEIITVLPHNIRDNFRSVHRPSVDWWQNWYEQVIAKIKVHESVRKQ